MLSGPLMVRRLLLLVATIRGDPGRRPPGFRQTWRTQHAPKRLNQRRVGPKDEKDFESHLKTLKMNERAFRSAKRRMYHRIPAGFGASMRCDEEPRGDDPFVVALASDEHEPLPIFAVMNSTLSNAVEPEKLSFVAIVTRSARKGLLHLVRRYIVKRNSLVGPRVSVCVGLEEQLRNRPAMKALIALGNSTRVKRKELLSNFNFAAFYLPHILRNPRILYLDSDVIVRSDVGELATMPMNDMPAAAVEDCTQRVSKYIDFPLAAAYRRAARVRVENLWRDGCNIRDGDNTSHHGLPQCEPVPRPLPPNTTCVFNRGVLVLNRDVWLREHFAEHIERHVIDFVHSRGALFRSGVSQPPFLLALATQYFKLPGEWNVRGLGRDAIGGPEWHVIASQTRLAYPHFVDVERELTEYMRVVAKVRFKGDERSPRFSSTPGHHDYQQRITWANVDRAKFTNWRLTILPQGPPVSPQLSENYNRTARILARLDAPSETHRGAATPDRYSDHYPYVCPYAAHAKILHFNGEVKPWRMPFATITHVLPAEGALCLWRDVSHQLRRMTTTTTNATKPRHLVGQRNIDYGNYGSGHSVADRISSCALDWHRYVSGYVADLRREALTTSF